MSAYGLIGENLDHSWSPALHRLLGCENYGLFPLAAEELEAFLRQGDYQGLNVTIPYKQAVLPYLDELSPLAKALGSVNTITKRPDGGLLGDNTDYAGFAFLLNYHGLDVAGKKVLILGSGGAAVTVKAVLEEARALPLIISRKGPEDYSRLPFHQDAAFIVNTTPLGMGAFRGQKPLSLDGFHRLEAVIDLIYNPLRTALLLEAEERSIPAINGLAMLAAQGAESEHIWGLCPEPGAACRKMLPLLKKTMENIILIGMPGAGKSTLARMLGETLGRPIYDSDEEIEKETGLSPGTFIEGEGEAAFRDLESKVLSRLGAMSGIILASGGGAVTRQENYPFLRQNGRIIWVRRPLEDLPLEGRPLSESEGVRALYQARAEAYHAFADHIIDNHGSLQHTLERLLEVLT